MENQENINNALIKKLEALEVKIKDQEKTIETILIRLNNQECLIAENKKKKTIHTFISV